jgi:uncharacterized protein
VAGGPFVVAVTDLARRPGTRKPVQRVVRLEGLAISSAAVDPDRDVAVDLELEAISNGIVAEGTLTVPWVGECRRCLTDVRGTADAEIREIFEQRPVEGETYPLGHDVVDLLPMVRDAALLALPLAPLCAEACEGPDPAAFPATVAADEDPDDDDAAEAGEPPRDPRWAALDQLGFSGPD